MPVAVDVGEDVLPGLEMEAAAHRRGGRGHLARRFDSAAVSVAKAPLVRTCPIALAWVAAAGSRIATTLKDYDRGLPSWPGWRPQAWPPAAPGRSAAFLHGAEGERGGQQP
jgi:hypothetical protein